MKVILDFTKKDYSEATTFEDIDLIHAGNMAKAMNIFEGLYQSALRYEPHEGLQLSQSNNTISIFASRGAGKTSFVLSFLDRIQKKRGDVLCLSPIDPSHLEQKQHPLVNVIAAIQEHVENRIQNNRECSTPLSRDFDKYKAFSDSYMALLKGLHIVDGIGEDNIYGSWNDDDYISVQGMDKAKAYNKLESHFHAYIYRALALLEKRCIVIAFDDIDTTFEKGFELLEIIRKYLTSPQIITILTGDQNLYTKLVRKNHWSCFDMDYLQKELNYSSKSKDEFSKLISQLENQYMVKLLKPENRVTLLSLKEYLTQDENTFRVILGNKKEISLVYLYREIFSKLYAYSSSLDKMVDFITGLSLRVQIQLLTLYHNFQLTGIQGDSEPRYLFEGLMNIFSSDIYQVSREAKLLINGGSIYTIHMLSLLVSNDCLNSATGFMPETNDETLNKALLAVGLKYDYYQNLSGGKYLIFDYWIRICYLKFLVDRMDGQANTKTPILHELLRFTMMDSESGLIKGVGLSQAYYNSLMFRPYIRLKSMPGTIYLGGSVPKLLSETNKTLPLLPLLGSVNNNNEERVFLSIYRLFAVLSEFFMKSKSTNVKGDAVVSCLRKLGQYRNYIEPAQEVPESVSAPEKSFYSISNEGESAQLKAVSIQTAQWVEQPVRFSIQQLDRIFTRFYYTLVHIEELDIYESVGEKFNAILCALLNAALVEKAIEKNNTEVNLNNFGDIEQVFLFNLQTVRQEWSGHHYKSIQWFMNCPLFRAYMNPLFLALIDNNDISSNAIMVEVFEYDRYVRTLEQLNANLKKIKESESKQQLLLSQIYQVKLYHVLKKETELNDFLMDRAKEANDIKRINAMKNNWEEKKRQLLFMEQSIQPISIDIDDHDEYVTITTETEEINEIIQRIAKSLSDNKKNVSDLSQKIRVISDQMEKTAKFVKKEYDSISGSIDRNSIFYLFAQIPLNTSTCYDPDIEYLAPR